MNPVSNEFGSEEPPSDTMTSVMSPETLQKNINYWTFKFWKDFYPDLWQKLELNSWIDTINSSTLQFKNKYYPQISNKDRSDRKRQLKNTIFDLEKLQKIINLTPDELKIFLTNPNTNFRITPYYLSLIDQDNFFDPLRKTIIPTFQETLITNWEEDDPLHEDNMSPVEWIIHRYPDRVLFLVTNFCSTRCRYCTRSRMIENDLDYWFNISKRQKCIDYIAGNPKVTDVLISWWDPLTMSDNKIDWLLGKIREIPHVEMIRIWTKVPTVLPQRITPELTNILKKYHPLFVSIHFAHPNELTVETSKACNDLADAGIPLWSQTVLMKDINDEVDTMRKLMKWLLKNRVKPYYIYQCDPISWSSHFRTKVEKWLEIIAWLRWHITWYGVPQYVIDAPWWGGKIPLLPEYFQWRDENGNVILKNYEWNIYTYPDF